MTGKLIAIITMSITTTLLSDYLDRNNKKNTARLTEAVGIGSVIGVGADFVKDVIITGLRIS